MQSVKGECDGGLHLMAFNVVAVDRESFKRGIRTPSQHIFARNLGKKEPA